MPKKSKFQNCMTFTVQKTIAGKDMKELVKNKNEFQKELSKICDNVSFEFEDGTDTSEFEGEF